jgi:hypothetical protein
VGEDTRRIENEIRAERSALDRNLQLLEHQARELADWRGHYARHAAAALSIAFGGGFLLGMAGRRHHRPPRARSVEPAAPAAPRAGFSPLKVLTANPRARQQVGDAWQNILEALVGVAAVKAVDWIGNVVPGFRDEWEARQPASGSPVARRHQG